MKIPKWFEKWFREWGLMNDTGSTAHSLLRIAWRAYRKGKKDYQVKPNKEEE